MSEDLKRVLAHGGTSGQFLDLLAKVMKDDALTKKTEEKVNKLLEGKKIKDDVIAYLKAGQPIKNRNLFYAIYSSMSSDTALHDLLLSFINDPSYTALASLPAPEGESSFAIADGVMYQIY